MSSPFTLRRMNVMSERRCCELTKMALSYNITGSNNLQC